MLYREQVYRSLCESRIDLLHSDFFQGARKFEKRVTVVTGKQIFTANW